MKKYLLLALLCGNFFVSAWSQDLNSIQAFVHQELASIRLDRAQWCYLMEPFSSSVSIVVDTTGHARVQEIVRLDFMVMGQLGREGNQWDVDVVQHAAIQDSIERIVHQLLLPIKYVGDTREPYTVTAFCESFLPPYDSYQKGQVATTFAPERLRETIVTKKWPEHVTARMAFPHVTGIRIGVDTLGTPGLVGLWTCEYERGFVKMLNDTAFADSIRELLRHMPPFEIHRDTMGKAVAYCYNDYLCTGPRRPIDFAYFPHSRSYRKEKQAFNKLQFPEPVYPTWQDSTWVPQAVWDELHSSDTTALGETAHSYRKEVCQQARLRYRGPEVSAGLLLPLTARGIGLQGRAGYRLNRYVQVGGQFGWIAYRSEEESFSLGPALTAHFSPKWAIEASYGYGYYRQRTETESDRPFFTDFQGNAMGVMLHYNGDMGRYNVYPSYKNYTSFIPRVSAGVRYFQFYPDNTSRIQVEMGVSLGLRRLGLREFTPKPVRPD